MNKEKMHLRLYEFLKGVIVGTAVKKHSRCPLRSYISNWNC